MKGARRSLRPKGLVSHNVVLPWIDKIRSGDEFDDCPGGGVFRPKISDLPAPPQHHDAIGHTHHMLHVVADENNGTIAISQHPDKVEHKFGLLNPQ